MTGEPYKYCYVTSAWTDEEVNEAIHQYYVEQSMKEYLVNQQTEGRMEFLLTNEAEVSETQSASYNRYQASRNGNPWQQTYRSNTKEENEPQSLFKAFVKGVWGMLH